MGQLATDVAGVNAKIVQQSGDGSEPTKADPGEVSGSLLELSARAEQLAGDAHTAEFEELSQQAHALHPRLKAIGQKLQKATGN
jgi:outer membrane murein-binding lipoprotein Lpp